VLRKLGKKTVFSFWGCDIRRPTELAHNRDYLCHHCLPGERQCESPFRRHLYRALRRYGDAVFLSGDLVKSYTPYHWLPNAIDLGLWDPERVVERIPEKYRLPKNGKILVLHAFANGDRRGDHKGTRQIEASVANLMREGLPIRYLTLDRIPVGDVKYIQVQADIVIDQFRLGGYGSFALESMALARPVVGWIEPELFRDQGETPPIVNTDLKGIESVLADLVTDPGKRQEIGKLSRGYVERIHDYRSIGRKLKGTYESLYQHGGGAADLPCDHSRKGRLSKDQG
jgi:glycosyltransferase involved in cell wall biosynthesis